MRLLKSLLSIYLMIILCLNISVAYAQPEDLYDNIGEDEYYGSFLQTPPNIDAESGIVVEAEMGQILYEKHSEDKLHISAACKLMTALIALEKSDLGAKVTISKESTETEGSVINLVIGEKYSLENLVYAIILGNYNDAALALSEHVSGDMESFVSLMNNMAIKLNMKNTFFTNPTGLFDENQYTTAKDMSLFIRYALKNPTFSRIFSTQARPWNATNSDMTVLTNQNELFWIYDGVDGGKTGYNNKEQHTAVTTASRRNMRLICIVLDSPEKSVFQDSIKLLDYAFSSFRKGILIRKGIALKSMDIQGNEIKLVSMNDVYYTYPLGKDYIKNISYKLSDDITLPLYTDRIIGTAVYVLEDNTIIEINLCSDREIKLPEDFYSSLKKKFRENRDILILAGVLLVIELLLILYSLIKLLRKLVLKLFSSRGN